MQGAETKVITVDITDASTLQLALRYPYTGNCHDDGESRAVTHNFSRSEATQVEPNDGDPQDDLGGSRADALLPKGLEDEIDGSEGTVASTPQGKAMLMLLDTRDPQLHERLDQNREETGQESNGYHDPIEDRPITPDEKDAAIRARLEAEEHTNEASRKGQEDKQNVIARVNQAPRCRHCSLENNVRFELERSHLGKSGYSFTCICRTIY